MKPIKQSWVEHGPSSAPACRYFNSSGFSSSHSAAFSCFCCSGISCRYASMSVSDESSSSFIPLHRCAETVALRSISQQTREALLDSEHLNGAVPLNEVVGLLRKLQAGLSIQQDWASSFVQMVGTIDGLVLKYRPQPNVEEEETIGGVDSAIEISSTSITNSIIASDDSEIRIESTGSSGWETITSSLPSSAAITATPTPLMTPFRPRRLDFDSLVADDPPHISSPYPFTMTFKRVNDSFEIIKCKRFKSL
ncbi:uncharacterized protein LOC107371024 [Tetranychus urticae]|uniref:uncharacterized protein LOC107371024 n=1 Tax=Tetranychus urticae TaxID=32264 RepID=UPI000D65BBF5|nr:uncharacterized protein LOC107371024 [Tetranychus urticae]